MIKIKNMIKILSLLLCLGFIFSVNDTLAKSIAEEKAKYQKEIGNTEKYGDCKLASNTLNNIKECTQEQSDVANAEKALESICTIYQSIKAEYKKCTSGGMDKSKAAKTKLDNSKTALKNCEKKADQKLKNVKDYLQDCAKAVKARAKADEAEVDAKEKAEKDKVAQEAATKAENEYNDAVAKCEAGDTNACSQMSALYKAYEKASKAAGKTAKAAKKAADKAEKKDEKADDKEAEASGADIQAILDNAPTYQMGPDGKLVKLNADGTALGGTNNMGAIGDLNTKAIECQKLTGSAQDACWDEYDAMASKAENEGKSVVIEGKYTCPAIGNGVTIFDYLACRITGVVRELRIIVYILAGFGMIAFAYGAIIGKISWKQLSNIAIGLFILSMTTSFIEYVTGATSGDSSLKYGNHLPNGDHHQFIQSRSDCSTDPSLCPGASGSALDMLKGEAESSSWSWSDLKASIGSVKDAVRTAANAYSTVKNTVDTVSTAVQGISSAIRNGGNIVDVVMDVADNVNTALKSVNNAGNSLAMSASSISNDLADAGSTAAQREYKDALRSEYQALKKKCEQGINGCSENEKKALAQLEQDLNDNTTGTDKWLNSTGSNILSALDKASDKANDAENKARDVKANQADGKAIGNKIGGSGLGDVLGAAMAIGTAIENSSDGKKK